MKFLIITHVKHKQQAEQFFAYAPYIREMNIWLKHVDEVIVVAPKSHMKAEVIDLKYNHNNLHFKEIPSIRFTDFKNILLSVFKLPLILVSIFKACRKADHIHLRCPGNIGMLGCFTQICFPKKVKTAKYAGNWDPKSKQPISYRIQKWILSNTFLTKNISVLEYGEWPNQTKNIKPFFTATYAENEKEKSLERTYDKTLKFIFLGSLVEGKQPLLAIQIVENLIKRGRKIEFKIYGDGVLKENLKKYVVENNLNEVVELMGNKDKEQIKEVLKNTHFLILPSKSEGWPKAIAEAMFFGAIPIATPVSCVPWMLDEGRRGILIPNDLNAAVDKIEDILNNGNLEAMSIASQQWSQNYTLDTFEAEIVKLLKP